MKMKKTATLICALVFALNANAMAAGVSVATHTQNWGAGSTVSAVKEMKSEWMRDEIRWKQVEWTKGTFALPTDASWSSWVNKAVKKGIKPLCILGFGNGSYQQNGDEYTSLHLPTYGTKTGDAAAKEQEYWNAWEEYVTLVATTYKGKIKAYEVWNEPNHEYFNNDINPENYAKLYIATRNLVKSIDPDAIVLCGSITGADSSGREFINLVLDYIKNNGGLSQIDAFSIHLYTHGSTPESDYLDSLNTLYSLTFAKKGYTGDIWMTENGKYTGSAMNSVTEADQAAMLVRQTAIWDSFLKSKNIDGENIWYDLKNDGEDLTESEHNFGLMNYDFTPKQAYTAASLFNTLTSGMSFKSLSVSSDKYIAEYANDKNGKHTFIAWKESGTGTVTINIPEKDTKVYSLGGTVTQTISTTGSKSFNVSSVPIMIASVPLPIEFGSGMTVSYNAQTRRVSISGTIENFRAEQEISFLAVPHGTAIPDGLNPLTIGYVGSIKTNSASFSHQFGIPAWFCGETDIYVGGYQMAESAEKSATVPDNTYVYAASIDVNKSTMSASAVFRNYASTAKEAKVIVAGYKAGVLVDMRINPVSIPANTYEKTVNTAKFTPAEAVDEVKAFVWSDTNSMVPLVEATVK